MPSGDFTGGGKTTPLAAATYNPASRSLTIVPSAALPLGRLYAIAVDGSTSPVLGNGLADVSGGLLEGSSGVAGTPYELTFGAGKRLTYSDSQSNVVTLQLTTGRDHGAVPVAGRCGAAARASSAPSRIEAP